MTQQMKKGFYGFLNQHVKKRITRSILLRSLCLVVSATAMNAVNADFLQICPYVGAEYKYMWTKGINQFQNALQDAYTGGSAFAGAKFSEYFGTELGYSRTSVRHRTQLSNRFFNSVNSIPIRTGARFTSFYFDVNGYYPLRNCWELIASIGVESMKPRISLYDVNAGITTNIPSNGTALLRVGAGAHYLFHETAGFRVMIRWEDLHILRIYNNHFIKSAVSAAAGIFFRF